MTGKANLSYQSVRSSRRSLIKKATCKGKIKQTQKAQKRTVVSDLHKRKQERRTPESFFQPECEPLSSPLALILLVLVSFYVNVMELTCVSVPTPPPYHPTTITRQNFYFLLNGKYHITKESYNSIILEYGDWCLGNKKRRKQTQKSISTDINEIRNLKPRGDRIE
ncbi:hypothetical protein YC2023_116015 [Brassica napus]